MKHPLFILLWWIKTSWTEEEEEEEENPAGSVYLELITNMGSGGMGGDREALTSITEQ